MKPDGITEFRYVTGRSALRYVTGRPARWRFFVALAGGLFLGLFFAGQPALAQQAAGSDPVSSGDKISAFQLSELYDLRLGALMLVREGRLELAERLARRLIDRFPRMPSNHYFLASVLARQNKLDAAFDRLTIAIRRGFTDVGLIGSDPVFEALRKQKRFQTLIDMIKNNPAKKAEIKPRKVSPAVIRNGVALVDGSNTLWDPKLEILKSFFTFSAKDTFPKKVQNGNAALQQLNEWYARGQAAGNIGDLYDNHDRGHSGGNFTKFFPQMARTKYSTAARNAGVDYGFNSRMFFNLITIGNSSTVAAGRSHARDSMTKPGMPKILYLQYTNNHLYVYPEHRDYDPDRGDLLPANTPYMIVSQGSSGSDIPFLRAVAAILAAFKPDVKDYLRQNHLVMPTVQIIFRRGQKTVKNKDDYLTAKANPPVFQPENIDLKKMIGLAHRLKIKDIPPLIRLTVVKESGPRPGIDNFSTGLSETLFNTPEAIARVIRLTAYNKRMIIRATNTGAGSGRKIHYRWVVLSGDKKRIKINARNKEASEVELIVPWHERRPVPGLPGMTTDRVEIGVFADDGKNYSAPAFVNFLYPPNQKRKYNERHQIMSIDYRDPALAKRYLEPRLFIRRDWKDVYKYDRNSRLIGWRRSRGKWLSQFTRDGAKVIEWDNRDRPIRARATGYALKPVKNKPPVMVETAGEEVFSYRYKDDRDSIGRRY